MNEPYRNKSQVLADTLYATFDGCNHRELMEQFGLSAKDWYGLIMVAQGRERLAQATWHQCGRSIYLADALASWALAHPVRWRSLPTHLQVCVEGQLHRASVTDDPPPYPGLDAATPPMLGGNKHDLHRAEVPTGQPANPTPEPWRHPILIPALVGISGSFVPDDSKQGGAI